MNIKHAIKPTCFAIAAFFGASSLSTYAENTEYESDPHGIIDMKAETDINGNKTTVATDINTKDASSNLRNIDDNSQANANLQSDATRDQPENMKMGVEANADQVVYFDFDSAELDDEAKSQLDSMVEDAELAGETLEIQGFTDNVGDENYNRDLSQRRADAVKQYLQDQVEDNKNLVFSTEAMGEDKPIASNHDAVGREKNRRVEIILKNRDQVAGL